MSASQSQVSCSTIRDEIGSRGLQVMEERSLMFIISSGFILIVRFR